MMSPVYIRRKRSLTTSWGMAEISRAFPEPAAPVQEPWIALLGDCFYFRLTELVFSGSPLHPNDCPVVITLPRGKIAPLMDLAEKFLPPTIEVLFVHVGANDLSSPRSNAEQVVDELHLRLLRLQMLLPSLRLVYICLLTPRIVDGDGRYGQEYIAGCNTRMRRFNELILSGRIRDTRFTIMFMDFFLCLKNLSSLLRITGFGLNPTGRRHIGSMIESKIMTTLRLNRLPPIPRNYLSIFNSNLADQLYLHINNSNNYNNYNNNFDHLRYYQQQQRPQQQQQQRRSQEQQIHQNRPQYVLFPDSGARPILQRNGIQTPLSTVHRVLQIRYPYPAYSY